MAWYQNAILNPNSQTIPNLTKMVAILDFMCYFGLEWSKVLVVVVVVVVM